MSEEEKSRGFWHSVPGILTGMAAIITAVTGSVVALYQAGFFDKKEQTVPQASHTTATPPKKLSPSVEGEATPSGKNAPSLETTISEPLTKSGSTIVPENQAPASSSEEEIPDWVPAYPFAEQENISLRRGAGSLSFETENSEQHVKGAYAAQLQAAGWKVATGYDGGYWASGISPGQQRSIAVIASSEGGKTYVAVSFLDHSLASREELSPPQGIPNWVPIYPGKIEKIHARGNVGGFSVITTHSEQQVRGLYAAILRTSGYEVTTGYDGGSYARGTAKSQERSISAIANTNNEVTKVLVLFEHQKEQRTP